MITPGEVAEGIALWRKYRPWLRMRVAIRAARNKRRARLGKPLLPSLDLEAPMVPLILELLGSIARIALPTATAYLAGVGIHLDGTSSTVTVGAAAAVYIAMQAWSIVRKVLDKPRATGTPPAA